MSKRETVVALLALALLLGFLSWGAWQSFTSEKPPRELPYYGPAGADSSQKGETSYHRIPPFVLTNQAGQVVDNQTFAGSVYVTDFFFTTCRSICPIMTTQMGRVYRQYQGDTTVRFLSHTVDPEHDSVAVLAAYAQEKGIRLPQWHLVTGPAQDIYRLAREAYFLDDTRPHPNPGEDFVHTQNFALVDREGHIRGIYDGTDSLAINRLMIDIGLLQKYYSWKASQH